MSSWLGIKSPWKQFSWPICGKMSKGNNLWLLISKGLSMKVTGSISTFMMTFVYAIVGFYSDKHKTLPQVKPVLCDEAVEQKSSIAVCLFLLHIQLNANSYPFEILTSLNSGRVSPLSIPTSSENFVVKPLD